MGDAAPTDVGDHASRVAFMSSGSIVLTFLCSSTGKSQFFVIYGADKRLPYDVLFESPKPIYSEDFNKVMLHTFQSVHQSVRKNLAESRAEIIQKEHLATPVTLTIGDQVMKRSPDRQCKLSPKFSGPFLITEKLNGHKFRVLHVQSNTTEVVHADRLKKFDTSSP